MNLRGFGIALAAYSSWALLALSFSAGCESGGESPASHTGSGGAGGSLGSSTTGTNVTTVGAGGSSCVENQSCTCPDGRQGMKSCGGDLQKCSCDGCPAFTPGMPTAWTACGGEPFGRWRTKATDTNGLKLAIYSTSGVNIGECPTQVTKPPDSYDLRLEVRDGGAFAYYIGIKLLSFDTLDSCIEEKVSQSCQSLKVNGSCTLGSCGICDCELSYGAPLSGKWTRTNTTLNFKTSSNETFSLDYCVQGDTMTVRDASGVLTTLERAAVTGTPTPCAQRTLDQCKMGGGCTPGVCVGTATCASATTEAICTTRQGCAWSMNQCGGTAPAVCELADYGVVPGCNFVPGTPKCVGTAGACTANTKQQCASVSGCQTVAGCIGSGASCAQFSHACSFCDGHPGCSCNPSGICIGTTTCEQQSFFNCTEVRGCSWVECTGTPTPCSQLGDLSCTNTPGCHLEVVPP